VPKAAHHIHIRIVLWGNIVAIMAKKPPVFYIKGYIVKKGKTIGVNAIDVTM
jgi:hypothetical protein